VEAAVTSERSPLAVSPADLIETAQAMFGEDAGREGFEPPGEVGEVVRQLRSFRRKPSRTDAIAGRRHRAAAAPSAEGRQ
jgi:hypothetical protein